MWVIVGLLFAAAVVTVAVLVWSGDGDPGEDILPPVSGSRAGSDAGLRADRANREEIGAEAVLESPDEEDRSRERVISDRPMISGRVLEKGTGKPIKSFHFRLRHKDGKRGPWPVIVNETVRDEEGRFSIGLARGGDHTLTVRSSIHALASFGDLNIPDDVGLRDFVVELDPGSSVSGRVVEAATGKPVENALVGSERETELIRIMMGHDEFSVHTYTDGKGRFCLKGLEEKRQKIAALHPDFAEGYVDVTPGRDAGEVVIELRPGYFVFGRALNDDGDPLGGLVISLFGRNPRIPIARKDITASDGTYKVGPAEPGRLTVVARPPPDENEGSFGFTNERKKAELIDGDIEINFGPEPGQVVWSGKVIDPTGLPVRGIEVSAGMDAAFMKESHSTNGGRARCGEDGSFVIRKLYPGRYRLYVDFPGQSGFEWEEIAFEKPGPVERDLLLECGAMKGEIVDAETGRMAGATRCSAQLEMNRRPFKSYSTFEINDGTFCLRGLQAGTYTVSASGRDIPHSEVEGVEVTSGGIVEGVKIEVPPSGRVEMAFLGFSDEEYINYHFMMEGGKYSHGSSSSKSSRTPVICLEPGEWRANFRLHDVGSIERTVRIDRDSIIEMAISREDFDPSSRILAVAGTIVFSDGSPIEGAAVDFSASDIPGLAEEESEFSGKTDETGRFVVDGFRPGSWNVRIGVPGMGTDHLPKVVIPENSPNPFVYNATVFRGKVVGRVYPDPAVIDILAGTRISFHVNLKQVETGNRVGRSGYASPGEDGGRPFEVSFVPPGHYTLDAGGTAHARYKSPAFSIGEDETVELPPIMLELTDAVILKVTDTAGEDLENVRIKFLDLEPYFRGIYLSSSIRFYPNDQLPPGPTKVRISARGHKEKELTLTRSPKGLEVVEVFLD